MNSIEARLMLFGVILGGAGDGEIDELRKIVRRILREWR